MTARILAAGALLLVSLRAPLGAQSYFNAGGLGLPMEAIDARARALGSVGIGLPGTNMLPTDPAASARTLVPGGVISAQPSWVDLTRDGASGHRYFRGSRFPLLAGGYPAFGGMITLRATSVFDQNFVGERVDTVDVGGVPTVATDRFEQVGSVATISVGYSRMLTPTNAVGLTVGRYVGSVRRSLLRTFGDSAAVNQVLPYGSSGTWTYSGYQITAGASSDVAGLIRLAASATLSTALDATATSVTQGADRSFDVPLQLRIGASGQLVPGLTVSASAARADWSSTAADLGAGARAGSVTSYGAGLELNGVSLFGRAAPLRLGWRHTGLPFPLDGNDAHERSLAGGLGLALNQVEEVVLASVDFALEKGTRVAGTYQEDFWRANISLKVSGF